MSMTSNTLFKDQNTHWLLCDAPILSWNQTRGSQRESVSGAWWHQATMPDLSRSFVFLKKGCLLLLKGCQMIFYLLQLSIILQWFYDHEIEKPIFNVFLKCTIIMLASGYHAGTFFPRSFVFLPKKGCLLPLRGCPMISYLLQLGIILQWFYDHEIEKPIFNVFLKCTINMLTITFNSKSIILR